MFLQPEAETRLASTMPHPVNFLKAANAK